MGKAQRVSGSRIREARLAAGMSQADLAYAIHKGERNIRRWESEVNTPSLSSIAAIAEATGRDLSYFLTVDEEEPSGDPFRGSDGPAEAGRGGQHRRRTGETGEVAA
jgi:transcriptional regulator with XRE-family HTH domain